MRSEACTEVGSPTNRRLRSFPGRFHRPYGRNGPIVGVHPSDWAVKRKKTVGAHSLLTPQACRLRMNRACPRGTQAEASRLWTKMKKKYRIAIPLARRKCSFLLFLAEMFACLCWSRPDFVDRQSLRKEMFTMSKRSPYTEAFGFVMANQATYCVSLLRRVWIPPLAATVRGEIGPLHGKKSLTRRGALAALDSYGDAPGKSTPGTGRGKKGGFRTGFENGERGSPKRKRELGYSPNSLDFLVGHQGLEP